MPDASPLLLALDEAPWQRADRLALDRGSVRSYDHDGRLHVAITNLSKANVCPYYGREIPNGNALGLEPDTIYKLLRDPEELTRAGVTLNNIPVIDLHSPRPITADNPQQDMIVGTTGSEAVFDPPYLKNSLAVWVGESIARINSGEQRELSCGYRYRADMTPGEWEGEHYDGVMRDIVFNHVALVPKGRAGPDVVVGDEQPRIKKMPQIKTATLPSRHALMVQGALAVALAPIMATDSQIDLGDMLKGVNRKNYAEKRSSLLAKLTRATKGKLATDADLEQVAEVLESLEGLHTAGEDELEEKEDDETAEGKEARDDEEKKEAKDRRARDEEEKKDEKEAKDRRARDEEEKKDEKEAKDRRARDEEKKDEDEKEKAAHDAALVRRAKSEARAETIAELRAIERAKAAVRPHIGEIDGDVGSASEVLKLCLDNAIENGVEIDLTGVPESAYPALVKMLPLPGAQRNTRPRDQLAADAAANESFTEMFPGASRIRQLG